MKRKMMFVVVALAGFVIGALGSGSWCWYAYNRWMILPREVELSSWTAIDTAALAHLRLHEEKEAIAMLENHIDGMVHSLAMWDKESPPNERIRTERDACLTSVKVYHESYPATGENAEQNKHFLAQIPGRNVGGHHCKSSVCRLDDLHHAAAQAGTNASDTKFDEPNTPKP